MTPAQSGPLTVHHLGSSRAPPAPRKKNPVILRLGVRKKKEEKECGEERGHPSTPNPYSLLLVWPFTAEPSSSSLSSPRRSFCAHNLGLFPRRAKRGTARFCRPAQGAEVLSLLFSLSTPPNLSLLRREVWAASREILSLRRSGEDDAPQEIRAPGKKKKGEKKFVLANRSPSSLKAKKS